MTVQVGGVLLKIEDLKDWLHRDLKPRDKLLIVLATFDAPCQIRMVRERAIEAGYKFPNKNLSDILGKSKGFAIRVRSGWEIAPRGREHLQKIGVTSKLSVITQPAIDLRNHLKKIKNTTIRAFVEEAIKCYEHKLHRSAVVMSWVAAISILHQYVYKNRLKEFNKEAKRTNPQWKPAKYIEDFNRMEDGKFLERLMNINILDKNVRSELKSCLDLRNSCSHPNPLKLGDSRVAGHIDILLQNVFEKFA